jgi:hypothetical protein
MKASNLTFFDFSCKGKMQYIENLKLYFKVIKGKLGYVFFCRPQALMLAVKISATGKLNKNTLLQTCN